MKNLTPLSLLQVAAAVVLLAPGYCHAYLDAGTGSMFIQLLFAGAAGVGAAARLLWHHLRNSKDKDVSPSEVAHRQ